MRFILLAVLLSGCGPVAESDCKKTGCDTGEICNVLTHRCVTPGTGGGAGGGSGVGGGSGGGGAGVGGGSGGGGGVVDAGTKTVSMFWSWESCPDLTGANTCLTCSMGSCLGPARAVPVATLTQWRSGVYGICNFDAGMNGEDVRIDCRRCTERMETSCDGGQRIRYDCFAPDMTDAGCYWGGGL